MIERNVKIFQIEQDNEIYFLTTSLTDDKIKFVFKDPNLQIFDAEYTKKELIYINNFFTEFNTDEDIQIYINENIEKQNIYIDISGNDLSIIINEDNIIIPLMKKNVDQYINESNEFNNDIPTETSQFENDNDIGITNQSYLANELNYMENNNACISADINIFESQNKNDNINNEHLYDDFNFVENRNNYINEDVNICESQNKQNIISYEDLKNENKNLKIQNEYLKIQNKTLKEKIENNYIKEKVDKYIQNFLKTKVNELAKRDKKIMELNLKIVKLKKLLNNNRTKDKIIELMEKLELKEKEIKELKSSFPFDLSQGEKLMSIIIKSIDQNIHRSFICKNTDKFAKIESQLYNEFSEYLETESENYFLVNSKKINRYKSLEENGIRNGDVILLDRNNYN